MDAKLKYIFLSIITLLVVSCNSDVPDAPDVNDSGSGVEVTFDIAGQSRGAVTSVMDFPGSQFAVYGDRKFPGYETEKIFDNTVVTYVTYPEGHWTYDEIRHWFPRHEYSFVAMHPVDAGVTGKEYSDSRLSFTYTLPDDFKLTRDLMVATHRRMYYEDALLKAAPVSLNFCHILSRINFQLTNDAAADIVRVDEIKLEGVDRTGSFSIVPASLSSGGYQTDDYEYEWSGISNNGNITANIRVDVPENEARPLFPDDNALLMVPQPDNKGVRMYITYTLIDGGTSNEQKTLTAETLIGGWEPGKAYTYSMAVCEITKEIYLTVSVKPWQTPTSADITVPES